MKRIARYDAAGYPINLEAAALDALEWLQWVKSPKRSAENDRRLAQAIKTLERLLGDVEMVFEDEQKTTPEPLPATMIEVDRQPQPAKQHDNPPPMPFDEFVNGGWKQEQST